MKPSIILTSKPAQQDLLNIKAAHQDMMIDMANHNVKVDAYKQQKAAELQTANTMKMEMDKEKMTANTESQRMTLDFQTKQGELNIKRASLT